MLIELRVQCQCLRLFVAADIVVQITAFHKGYFEFRICKNDRPQMGKDASVAVRQSCFDRYLLKNSTGGTT